MFWWKMLRWRQCTSSKMFLIFHWNVSDVPVECLWCSARINISGACQMAVQNPVRYPANIFLIIPPSFFPVSEENRRRGRKEKRLWRNFHHLLCDWCRSERSDPKRLCVVITACWVTRAHTHTHGAGCRCRILECVWNDVHLQGPWEPEGLNRNTNSIEIKGQRSSSCSHVKYPVWILTHTHTRVFLISQYKSWTGAVSVSQSGYEGV